MGLWAHLDAALARKVNHTAQLVARDRIDIFERKPLILVLDAGTQRDARAADSIAERRERLEHLEIVIARALILAA